MTPKTGNTFSFGTRCCPRDRHLENMFRLLSSKPNVLVYHAQPFAFQFKYGRKSVSQNPILPTNEQGRVNLTLS